MHAFSTTSSLMGVVVRRDRTAIYRSGYSKPITLALQHGVIRADLSVFDYGCGHGEDVRYLRLAGVEAKGWDPSFEPDNPICSADIVNLGYVLNVIEDADERDQTLRRAFELAQKALVVAVRVEHSSDNGREFADGRLTSRGSFQKIYKQSEFREYLERILGRRPHLASLGIAYAFKDEELEVSYLASLSRANLETSRSWIIENFAQDPIAKEYLKIRAVLGRPPVLNEFDFYAELLERFGPIQRIERFTHQLLSPEAIQESRRKRRDDILTHIAIMRLQGLNSVPYMRLPREIQADIKMIWRSYSAALKEGEAFLFQMGNPKLVRESCENAAVGKKLPDGLYLHRSVEEQLGALLRLLIFAARQVVGEVDYNVVKISTDGRAVSFLQYKDFDESPHPELQSSVRIYLPRAVYSLRDYSQSVNPPILHRKESLLDPLYPNYEVFQELTRQEEEEGLLSRIDIGTRQGWLTALAGKRLCIKNHCLVRMSENVEASS